METGGKIVRGPPAEGMETGGISDDVTERIFLRRRGAFDEMRFAHHLTNGFGDLTNAETNSGADINRALELFFENGEQGGGDVFDVNVIFGAIGGVEDDLLVSRKFLDDGAAKARGMFPGAVRIENSRPTEEETILFGIGLKGEAEVVFATGVERGGEDGGFIFG